MEEGVGAPGGVGDVEREGGVVGGIPMETNNIDAHAPSGIEGGLRGVATAPGIMAVWSFPCPQMCRCQCL